MSVAARIVLVNASVFVPPAMVVLVEEEVVVVVVAVTVGTGVVVVQFAFGPSGQYLPQSKP